MMFRIAHIAIVLALATSVSAQEATCLDQADFVVENVPNLESQTGVRSGQEFVSSETRLLLSMALYSHAGQMLMVGAESEAVSSAPPRQYCLQMLVVTDGLIRCFSNDGADFDDSQRAMRSKFFEKFNDQVRTSLSYQAMSELKTLGDS